MRWPSDRALVGWWPSWGEVSERRVVGSGVRLETSLGVVWLKRRPVDRLAGELWVLDRLAGQGLPVTLPLPTAEGELSTPWADDALWAYAELPGRALDLQADDAGTSAGLLGGASGRLGEALGQLDTAAARERGLPTRPNQSGCEGLATQVIHRDLHAGNVLFTGAEISGYLDFDHLEIGPRVVDLCYPATSLLALMHTGASAEHVVDPWLTRWRGLVRGYAEVAPLTDLELRRTAELMTANQHDFLEWFESRGDADNASLTRAMLRFVDDHAEQIVAEAVAAAGVA